MSICSATRPPATFAYDGGYCPQGLTFAQRTEMLDKDPEGFCKLVDKSLHHHYEMICKLHEQRHLLL
jgi:urocanate hydratase